MKKTISVILFAIAVIFFSSCKKDKPVISETPEIEFSSITPSVITQFQDKLTITISYTDGDGDLGENNPDAKNLFVTDMRNNLVYAYRIKQLAPDNADIVIKGNLEIVMDNVPILNGSAQETVTYSVYLKDRAGNTSNTVTTTAVTVKQ